MPIFDDAAFQDDCRERKVKSVSGSRRPFRPSTSEPSSLPRVPVTDARARMLLAAGRVLAAIDFARANPELPSMRRQAVELARSEARAAAHWGALVLDGGAA